MDFDVQNRRSRRRMLTVVSGRHGNTVTNTYDFAGRLKDESLTIATKTYTVSRTYDSLGRLFQMTYPNSTVIERTYTDRDQLYTVKYGSNIEDTRTYDDGGRLSTSAYRNGVTTTYNNRNVSGDKDNLLASIQFAHPGGTATIRQVGDLTYTWDANKNKTKETIAGTLSGYSFDTTLGTDPDGYDDEDRITYFKRSNTTNPQTWTLTSVGDWSSWNNFSTTAETRTHGAAHELTRIGSGTTPATILYDTKGNITQNQRTPGTSSTYQNYVWDFDNRMMSADTNGDNTADVTYEYDALGRRVARTQGATAVVYIHAGQQVVCDYTRGANANTTPAFRYVWGDYIDEPILRQTGSSTLLYYHHNQQYSTVALTSASGLVVTRYGYTAYGDQTILSHTGASQTYATYSIRHTYTGREWDDSLKAHNFRARWYDAALGRFVNRDPIGYADGASLYKGYFGLSKLDSYGKKSSYAMTYDVGGWTIFTINSCFTACMLKGIEGHLKDLGECYAQCQKRIPRSDGTCKNKFGGAIGDEDIVTACMKDAFFISAWNLWKGSCLFSDRAPVNVTCDFDRRDSEFNGTYDCKRNLIRINPQNINPCTILAHELLHAADDCLGNPDCERRDKKWLLCKEARANGFFDCSDQSTRGKVKYEDCMKAKRNWYVKKYCGREDFPQCFADWDACAPKKNPGSCKQVPWPKKELWAPPNR